MKYNNSKNNSNFQKKLDELNRKLKILTNKLNFAEKVGFANQLDDVIDTVNKKKQEIFEVIIPVLGPLEKIKIDVSDIIYLNKNIHCETLEIMGEISGDDLKNLSKIGSYKELHLNLDHNKGDLDLKSLNHKCNLFLNNHDFSEVTKIELSDSTKQLSIQSSYGLADQLDMIIGENLEIIDLSNGNFFTSFCDNEVYTIMDFFEEEKKQNNKGQQEIGKAKFDLSHLTKLKSCIVAHSNFLDVGGMKLPNSVERLDMSFVKNLNGEKDLSNCVNITDINLEGIETSELNKILFSNKLSKEVQAEIKKHIPSDKVKFVGGKRKARLEQMVQYLRGGR